MDKNQKKGLEHEVKGTAKKAEGKADEIAGSVKGDTGQQVKGKLKHAGGEVQKKYGEQKRKT